MYTSVDGVNHHVSVDGEVTAIGISRIGVALRAPGSYDPNEASDDAALVCRDPTRAKQSFKDECDINVLMERFGMSYQIPAGLRVPTYGDFTGVSDYHSAANAIALAHESFDQLPADVRYRFQNDPGAFVAFCSDEANRSEAVKLGLVPPPPEVVAAAPAASTPVSGDPPK